MLRATEIYEGTSEIQKLVIYRNILREHQESLKAPGEVEESRHVKVDVWISGE